MKCVKRVALLKGHEDFIQYFGNETYLRIHSGHVAFWRTARKLKQDLKTAGQK
jgi:hypothetical protein